MLPPLTGVLVNLVKHSSIVSVIAIFDLTTEGRSVAADTFMSFEVWLTVAGLYLVVNDQPVARGDMAGTVARAHRHGQLNPRPRRARKRAARPSKRASTGVGHDDQGNIIGARNRSFCGSCDGGTPAIAQQPAGKMISDVKERKTLRVGMASFVPWAMRDKQGNWIGFEIDVAKKFASDLGVDSNSCRPHGTASSRRWQPTSSTRSSEGSALRRPEANPWTSPRPYSTSGIGVAASKQIASKLKWPDDYNSADVTFTCKRGIAACAEVQKQFPKATLRQFDDTAIAFQEVINGSAHATVSSEPAPTFYTIQNPDQLFQPTKDYLARGAEGIAIRKGDPASLATINDWVTKNGDFLKERHAYWFRTRDWANQIAQ